MNHFIALPFRLYTKFCTVSYILNRQLHRSDICTELTMNRQLYWTGSQPDRQTKNSPPITVWGFSFRFDFRLSSVIDLSQKMPPHGGILKSDYFFLFSHFWFAIPQLVLQADWQEVWHSPQPPFFALSQRFLVFKVLIAFIWFSSEFYLHIISDSFKNNRNHLYWFIITRAL